MNEKLNVNNVINEKFDVFISFVSFETRTFSFADKLDINNIEKVLIIRNEKSIDNGLIIGNARYFENKFRCGFEYVNVDLDNPIHSADILKEKFDFLNSNNRKVKVLLDISTFTHEILLLLLCIFKQWAFNMELTCVYCNTLDYSIKETVKNKWLSKGIKEVRTVLGFPGDRLPSKKTHLIVIVGYEYERAYNIINIIEPNSLSLGYVTAEETSTEKNKDANTHYLKLVEEMAISYNDIEKFTISCKNISKTVKQLEGIIEFHGSENVVIVPLNNKVSTIAVAVAVFNNPKVQICYGQPVVYNEESYSVPGNEFYCYKFENGDWGL